MGSLFRYRESEDGSKGPCLHPVVIMEICRVQIYVAREARLAVHYNSLAQWHRWLSFLAFTEFAALLH